ncbi:MAG: holo-ACP synthase [Cyclobacteriaceae bacterium]
MLKGIGTDIVENERFRNKVEDSRFTKKLFTENEIVYCKSKKTTAHESLAARYAAKEAFMKALGTGYAKGVSFTEIEIQHSESRAPVISLSGETKEIAKEAGITQVHLSISHEKDYSIAFVILE